MRNKLIGSMIAVWTMIGLLGAGELDWQQAVDKIRDKVVLIEYYEQFSSPEAIVEKGRIKRHLTGLLVDDSGLIVTSSSIFRANLEFTSSPSFFSDAQAPIEIRVKWDDEDYQPADFIGKDDDKMLAFIRLRAKPKTSALHFEKNLDLKLGSRILIIQHLPGLYDHELMVNQRLINAVISKPQKKYLCQLNIRALSVFGLVLNEQGKAIAILQNFSPPLMSASEQEMDYFDAEFGETGEIAPFDSFKDLIKDPPLYREKETARKKWLGIYMQPFTRQLAKYFGYPQLEGVLINTVLKESPAGKAGLRMGDVILSVAGRKMASEKDADLEVFRNLIREQKNPLVPFEVFRDGQSINIEVMLGDTPISQFLADEISSPTLGFSVKELTQDIITAKQLEAEATGIWVSKVERAGWADVAGLGIGDLILQVNDQPVENLTSFKEKLKALEKEKPQYISLFVKRRADTRFYFLKTNFEN